MTAKVSKRLGLIAVACLVVGALISALRPAKQPSYDGEPLAFWFKRLPQVHYIRTFAADPNAPLSGKVSYAQPSSAAMISYGVMLSATTTASSTQDYPTALKAIRVMGTNALPFLLRKLEQRPPSSRLAWLRRSAAKWSVTAGLFPDVGAERAQAVTGLLVLCPLPPEVLQKLRTLSLDFDGPAWSQAGDVLKASEDPGLVRNALSRYE